MDLNDIIFAGIVEENVDPRRLGRIKVRVQCIFDEIPHEHLPWSSPYIAPNGLSFSVPPVGKMINVIFDNGNLYSPYYFFTDKYNLNLQDKLESLTDDEYSNFNALIFDHKTQISSSNQSLIIDYLVNKITMTNKNINLELKDNNGKITLGTVKADQRAVLGDHFIIEWFQEFLKILVKPTALTGNMGSPVLKADLDAHINKFLNVLKPEYFVSKNVFIVDNKKVDKLERDTLTNEVEHDDVSIVSSMQSSGQGGQGINIETSLEMDEDSRNAILKKQDAERIVLKEALPENTSSANINNDASPKKDKRTKPKMGKFSADVRERVDRLSSSKVSSRKGGKNVNNSNSNYGPYMKS